MFKKAPSLWNVRGLEQYFKDGEKAGIYVNGNVVWYPARPEGDRYSFIDRLRLAWMVFSGKADAVYWIEGQ